VSCLRWLSGGSDDPNRYVDSDRRKKRLIRERNLFQVVVVGRRREMSDSDFGLMHALGQMWVDWCEQWPLSTVVNDACVTSRCVHVEERRFDSAWQQKVLRSLFLSLRCCCARLLPGKTALSSKLQRSTMACSRDIMVYVDGCWTWTLNSAWHGSYKKSSEPYSCHLRSIRAPQSDIHHWQKVIFEGGPVFAGSGRCL